MKEDPGKEIEEASSTLRSILPDVIKLHNKSENDRNAVCNLHEKTLRENKSDLSKISKVNRAKLRAAYSNGLKSARAECAQLRRCLDAIHELRRLKEDKRLAPILRNRPHNDAATSSSSLYRSASPSGRTTLGGGGAALRRGALLMLLQKTAASLPLWLGGDSDDEPPPPLCGALSAPSNHVPCAGALVAARVKGADGEENWILAEVKRYDSSSGQFDVEDIDDEQKERYTLGKKRIVPLPLQRAHPQLNPEALYPIDSVIWALYPQTTCFYKGVVQRQPHGPNDNYLISFEDSSFVTGFSPPLAVPQRYIFTK